MFINSKKILSITLLFLLVSSASAYQKAVPPLNFLKSAIVPGWGQISLKKNYGYGFLALEAGLWTFNFYCHSESNSREDASRKYAMKYADVDPYSDYSFDFYEDMRHYMSSGFEEGGYNYYVALEAAEKYPDDSEAQQAYISAHAYDENHYWKWESEDTQHQFSIYRKRIQEYTDYLKVLGGAIAANHLISGFDALRLSNQLNRIHFSVDFNSDNIPLLSCSWQFR